MLRSSESVLKWLAVIRIYGGAFWLIHGVPKFTTAGFMPPAGFMVMATQRAAVSTTGPYHSFVVGTVVPHIAVFAELVRFGEVLVGVSLLLGLFGRIGAGGGMFLALNYALSKNALAAPDGYAGLDAAAFMLSFVNLVLPTNAVWAFDALRGRARRRRM